MTRRRFRFDGGQAFIHTVLVLLATFTFVPVLTLLALSVKDTYQFINQPMGLTFPFEWKNYEMAWAFMRDPLAHNIIVATAAVSANLFMASLSAYVFARHDFPFRNVLFSLVGILLFVPGTVLLVPNYVLIINLKVQNTLMALILPYAAQQVFTLVVLRTFFEELPSEMFDAAKVDGASAFQEYIRIAIPLSWPIISAMAIFQVWQIWNDYAWPSLVANSNEARTAVTGLIYFNDFSRPEPGAGMAAAVIAAVPMLILFLVTMRSFIAGLTAGAVKG